jgi:hypothetical protein
MKLSRALEQQIAVFGESGSGKTVMLSSFYGATQEPQFLKSSLFHVVADDIGQGNRLHRNYLGMRDSARRPETTRFASTSYAFSVKLKDGNPKANSAKPFDALRLIWHDYPGDWFEQHVSGEEAQRRIDTFRSLLGSDVAILLVDGQRLLDNAGEEERYLKSLLGNFRNGLLSLKDTLLEDGKPLVRFPRIWMLALSKADLLPDVDVFTFRDLIIDKATDDLEELRKVLAGLVESSEALAVGEDFLLLSSAKFEANRIEVAERVGLDLVLPIAAMLPFERHVRWTEEMRIGAKVVEELLVGVGALAAALLGKAKFGGPKGVLAGLIGGKVVDAAAELAGDKLKEKNADALAKQDYMSAVLTGFRLNMDKGEEERVLLRSQR